jgi:hypothetical protein
MFRSAPVSARLTGWVVDFSPHCLPDMNTQAIYSSETLVSTHKSNTSLETERPISMYVFYLNLVSIYCLLTDAVNSSD